MIVFITQDLMMQSSASAAARSTGTRIIAVPTLARAVEKIQTENVKALFVDLQTRGLKIADMIRELRSLPAIPTTIAFAQHVEEELLQAADTDVFSQVITRGQFNTRLPEIIRQCMTHGEN